MLQNAVTTEEAMPKDKEERRLSKVKIGIMRNPMFALWSGLMTVGKTSITDSIFVPTACTNGRDELYGREFVKRLDDKELTFVVLHETLHKAYRHMTTWSKLAKQDAQVTNMACDYVINLQIMDMDKTGSMLAMPTFEGKAIGLLDERFRNMNVKQVYDILKAEEPEGGYGGGGESGMDDHDWEGAGNLTKEEVEEFMQTEAYEQLDELSKKTLGSYIKKAADDKAFRMHTMHHFAHNQDIVDSQRKKYNNSEIVEQIHNIYPDELPIVRVDDILDKLHVKKEFNDINLYVHRLESIFKYVRAKSEIENWVEMSNPFPKSCLSNSIANLSIDFNHLGRTLYNKFQNFDTNLMYDDENSYNELLNYVAIRIRPPETISMSVEYVESCRRNNREPIGNFLNIGNLINLNDNLTKYRQILYKNIQANNRFSIILHKE
jgi:hypothetical protein